MIMKWLARKLYPHLADLIIVDMEVGGNCGVCGKWVSDAIVIKDWHYIVCKECTEKKEVK